MSVKIFLPAELYNCKTNCDIYGEIQINENNAITYFITAHSSSANDNDNASRRHLGHILHIDSALQEQDVALSFVYDAVIPNIYINKLSIKPTASLNVNVFLYEASKIVQLQGSAIDELPVSADTTAYEQCDSMRMLFHLLRAQHSTEARERSKTQWLLNVAFSFPFAFINRLFILLMECRALIFLLQQTFFFEHFIEWKKFRASGVRKANIALDKILGISVMLLLLFYIPHPGDYLIDSSHYIIGKLRFLLRALKGSPIGLKLNVQLNNFFLDCFNYHIDLWATFLNLIEPFVRQLFVPIALLGSMGLSYQLALLADLISVIGLHAHCFYIYTAVLYKVEIKGLQVLWRVVLGKRRNLLKNRVESHNYLNRQLYLATIFFTSLLFLFPTILVYYCVFTTLRLCIYLATLVLQLKRRQLLSFPLSILSKWLMGNFYEIESIQLAHRHHVPLPHHTAVRMSVFKLNVQCSSLSRVFSCKSRVLKELTKHEQTTLKSIFSRILAGKF